MPNGKREEYRKSVEQALAGLDKVKYLLETHDTVEAPISFVAREEDAEGRSRRYVPNHAVLRLLKEYAPDLVLVGLTNCRVDPPRTRGYPKKMRCRMIVKKRVKERDWRRDYR
jgi:hypothetical protein